MEPPAQLPGTFPITSALLVEDDNLIGSGGVQSLIRYDTPEASLRIGGPGWVGGRGTGSLSHVVLLAHGDGDLLAVFSGTATGASITAITTSVRRRGVLLTDDTTIRDSFFTAIVQGSDPALAVRGGARVNHVTVTGGGAIRVGNTGSFTVVDRSILASCVSHNDDTGLIANSIIQVSSSARCGSTASVNPSLLDPPQRQAVLLTVALSRLWLTQCDKSLTMHKPQVVGGSARLVVAGALVGQSCPNGDTFSFADLWPTEGAAGTAALQWSGPWLTRTPDNAQVS